MNKPNEGSINSTEVTETLDRLTQVMKQAMPRLLEFSDKIGIAFTPIMQEDVKNREAKNWYRTNKHLKS